MFHTSFKLIYFQKAAYLDPEAFKYMSQNEIKETELKFIAEFKAKPAPEQQNTQQNDFGPNLQAKESQKKPVLMSFADKYGLSSAKVNLTTSDEKRIQDELLFYKKQIESNELSFSDFWKKNCACIPLLSSAVRKYCIIPASSVAVESAFSEANFIQRKEVAFLQIIYGIL